MSKRLPEIFLFDVFIAGLKIKNVSKNFKNANELKENFVYWDSVIREFEIIGEATKNLINLGVLSDNYKDIVDFRNVLIHEYFGIDEEEVWGIIYNHLDNYLEIIKRKIEHISKEKKAELIKLFKEENKHIDFIIKELNNLEV